MSQIQTKIIYLTLITSFSKYLTDDIHKLQITNYKNIYKFLHLKQIDS